MMTTYLALLFSISNCNIIFIKTTFIYVIFSSFFLVNSISAYLNVDLKSNFTNTTDYEIIDYNVIKNNQKTMNKFLEGKYREGVINNKKNSSIINEYNYIKDYFYYNNTTALVSKENQNLRENDKRDIEKIRRLNDFSHEELVYIHDNRVLEFNSSMSISDILNELNREDDEGNVNDTYICGLNTCLNGGKCNSTNHCNCDDNYDTFPLSNITSCNYKKKSTLKSFFLEFFIPLGAGHLYLERYEIGFFKAFYFFVSLGIFITYYYVTKSKHSSETTELVIALNASMFVPLFLIWHIIDVVLLACSNYEDGNGISLNGW